MILDLWVIGYEAIQIMFYHSYLFMYDMVDTTDNTFVRYGGIFVRYIVFPDGDAL